MELQRPVAQPRWNNASVLLYAGGFVVLGAAVEALVLLSHDYSDSGFVGWTALVFGVLAALGLLLRRIGSWIAGGVFAFSAVVGWGVLAGALEQWFGWLPGTSDPFRGFHVGVLLLALLVLGGALVALRSFRFPLLVVPVVVASWYFVTDLISSGGNWTAVVTLLVGLIVFVVARTVDSGASHPYGFWLHVAAGVFVAGALIWFWHSSETDWALLAVAALVYIGIAEVVRRSSYTVMGAYGLYLSAVHFADKWSHQSFDFLSLLPFLLFSPFYGGFGTGPDGGNQYAPPLTFAFLGFLLLAVGLVIERRHTPRVMVL